MTCSGDPGGETPIETSNSAGAYNGMRVDMREHALIRDQVRAGLLALRVQGRQIWGDTGHSLPEIVVRLMVGVGDIARQARDGVDWNSTHGAQELKKEFGNILFSVVRWADDMRLDPLECLDLAIEAQERFAASRGRR